MSFSLLNAYNKTNQKASRVPGISSMPGLQEVIQTKEDRVRISGVAVHRLPQLAFAQIRAGWVSSIQEAVATVPASDTSTGLFPWIEF
jgi:hypothetical protein